MRSVTKIVAEVDAIVDTDIGSIQPVAENVLNGHLSFLGDIVDQVLDGYEVIKEERTFFLDNLQTGTEKID